MQEMQFASSEWKGVVGTLPGIDTQGSYSAATRYSTSSSLSVNRSITSTHAQQSTALKPHAREPGNRIVATLGPYSAMLLYLLHTYTSSKHE